MEGLAELITRRYQIRLLSDVEANGWWKRRPLLRPGQIICIIHSIIKDKKTITKNKLTMRNWYNDYLRICSLSLRLKILQIAEVLNL